MKKVVTTDIVSGVRGLIGSKQTLEHLQEAFQEVLSELMKGLTSDVGGIVILHGCVDSDPDALDWNISAGAALYNGEIFEVPASGLLSHATEVPVLSITTTYRTGDPVKFSDNNEFNVHAIRKLTWALGTSGSGLVDFDDVKRFKDTIKANNVQAGDKIVRFKAFDSGPWDLSTVGELIIPYSAYQIPHDKIIGTIVHLRSDAAIELSSNRFESSHYLFTGPDNWIQHYYEYSGGNPQLVLVGSSAANDNDTDNRAKIIIFYEE